MDSRRPCPAKSFLVKRPDSRFYHGASMKSVLCGSETVLKSSWVDLMSLSCAYSQNLKHKRIVQKQIKYRLEFFVI